jgi:hypothetical protein
MQSTLAALKSGGASGTSAVGTSAVASPDGATRIQLTVTPADRRVTVDVDWTGAPAAAGAGAGAARGAASAVTAGTSTSGTSAGSAPTPAGTSAAKTPRKLTRSEVATHCKDGDCWVIIDGKVYDVSAFLDDHPVRGVARARANVTTLTGVRDRCRA